MCRLGVYLEGDLMKIATDPFQKTLRAYLAAKKRKERAEEDFEQQKATLIGLMRQEGRKTIAMEHEDKVVRGTLSSNTRMSWDEDGLKKAIGAEAFKKVTKPKVDSTKMREAISMGVVDPNKVAMHCTETHSYYIRTSEKKKDDES